MSQFEKELNRAFNRLIAMFLGISFICGLAAAAVYCWARGII